MVLKIYKNPVICIEADLSIYINRPHNHSNSVLSIKAKSQPKLFFFHNIWDILDRVEKSLNLHQVFTTKVEISGTFEVPNNHQKCFFFSFVNGDNFIVP